MFYKNKVNVKQILTNLLNFVNSFSSFQWKRPSNYANNLKRKFL